MEKFLLTSVQYGAGPKMLISNFLVLVTVLVFHHHYCMTKLLQHCYLPFAQGKIQKRNCSEANSDTDCTTGKEK